MKACWTCGETKPLMGFYSQTNGSLCRDCKPCTCAKVRANRLVKLDYYRSYDRQRANEPQRIAARESYANTPEGQSSATAAKRRYIERNPVKRYAHSVTWHAIHDGRLKQQPCEVCAEPKAQAHHDDYSKPLDVRWLCTKHHAEWHKHNTPICPSQERAA